MTIHSTRQLLHNRYQIIEPLGRGGLGFTYVAQDVKTNQPVALKILSLKRAADWKKLELFEREAKVLAQLNHPGIPHYIDYFQIDTSGDRNFCIAQQLAPGKSLEQWMEAGWQPSTQDIEHLATQLLKILIYLQALLPPVIHRDIKPQNIIRDKTGTIFLVDFGSVQDTYRQSVTKGSTVVGTFGYMAPEQFRGQAVLSTDLYGMGATLLYLLTGQSPAEFPQRQLKIEFRSALSNSQVDKLFVDWLERLLEPKVNHRFHTAQEALNVLHGKQPLPPPPPVIIAKPSGTPIQIEKNPDKLSIKIPAIGFRTPQIQRFAIANLIWNGFLGFVVVMMISLQLFLAPAKLIGFGILVTIGLFLLVKYIYGALGVTQVVFEGKGNTMRMERWLLGSPYQQLVFSPVNLKSQQPTQAEQVQVKQLKFWLWHQVPFTYCSIRLKSISWEFGGFLTAAETEWLSREIEAFLQ